MASGLPHTPSAAGGTGSHECDGRPLTLAALALAFLRLHLRGCCFTIPIQPITPKIRCGRSAIAAMAGWLAPPRDRLEIGSAMANHAAYLAHWVELCVSRRGCSWAIEWNGIDASCSA